MRQLARLTVIVFAVGAGLATSARPAGARSGPPGPRVTSITGTVQSVARWHLMVRTRRGIVRARFDFDTHITKQVAVGRRGLYIDARIRLRLVPGTRTATQIVIAREAGLSARPTSTASLCARRPRGSTTKVTQAIGQIVRIRAQSVTVRACGTYITYALARGVTVRQTRLGRIADLRRGEVVSVSGPSGAPATAIVILNA